MTTRVPTRFHNLHSYRSHNPQLPPCLGVSLDVFYTPSLLARISVQPKRSRLRTSQMVFPWFVPSRPPPHSQPDDHRLSCLGLPLALPYEVETLAEMDERLEQICCKLAECVKAREYGHGFRLWNSSLNMSVGIILSCTHHVLCIQGHRLTCLDG
jgi:hypothetical protein